MRFNTVDGPNGKCWERAYGAASATSDWFQSSLSRRGTPIDNFYLCDGEIATARRRDSRKSLKSHADARIRPISGCSEASKSKSGESIVSIGIGLCAAGLYLTRPPAARVPCTGPRQGAAFGIRSGRQNALPEAATASAHGRAALRRPPGRRPPEYGSHTQPAGLRRHQNWTPGGAALFSRQFRNLNSESGGLPGDTAS